MLENVSGWTTNNAGLPTYGYVCSLILTEVVSIDLKFDYIYSMKFAYDTICQCASLAQIFASDEDKTATFGAKVKYVKT